SLIKRLDHLIGGAVTPLVRSDEPRCIAHPAVLDACVLQVARRWLLRLAIGKATMHQEAEHVEQLDKLSRRVAKAQPAVGLYLAVTIQQSIEEPLQVLWVGAEVARWQVPLVALAELDQQTCPWQGGEGQAEFAPFGRW